MQSNYTKTALLYGFIGLWLATFSMWVWSEALSPRLQAVQYLREHGGIAVLVSVGTKDIYTGDQIGQAIVKKFKSIHNVEIVYFDQKSTGDFGYVEFYIDGFGLGQYGADAWDTPEKLKTLFDDIYYYYIAGLRRKLH